MAFALAAGWAPGTGGIAGATVAEAPPIDAATELFGAWEGVEVRSQTVWKVRFASAGRGRLVRAVPSASGPVVTQFRISDQRRGPRGFRIDASATRGDEALLVQAVGTTATLHLRLTSTRTARGSQSPDRPITLEIVRNRDDGVLARLCTAVPVELAAARARVVREGAAPRPALGALVGAWGAIDLTAGQAWLLDTTAPAPLVVGLDGGSAREPPTPFRITEAATSAVGRVTLTARALDPPARVLTLQAQLDRPTPPPLGFAGTLGVRLGKQERRSALAWSSALAGEFFDRLCAANAAAEARLAPAK